MISRAFFISSLLAIGIAGSSTFIYGNYKNYDKNEISEIIQSKDTEKLIKELVTKIDENLEKDTDKFPDIIVETEQYIKDMEESASTAFLHSLLAEMYSIYYNANRWTIDQRTSLQDFVPEDIREWSANIFDKKIREELKASLSPAEILQNTKTESLGDVIKKGKDSETLRPTLFDFLAFRAIDIKADNEWFEMLKSFHLKDGNKDALINVELEYLDFRRRNKPYLNDTEYKTALDCLANSAGNSPLAIEIAIKQFNLYEQSVYAKISDRNSRTSAIYNKCKEYINIYKDNPRVVIFENRLAEMEQSFISCSGNRNVYPGKDLELNLEYRNLDNVKVCIYQNTNLPINATRDEDKHKGKKVAEKSFALNHPDKFSQMDTTLHIQMDKPGLYIYEINDSKGKLKTNGTFSVSRLAMVTRQLEDGTTEAIVTDFMSGKPIGGATVITYNVSRKWISQKLETYKTDKKGKAILSAKFRKKREVARAVYGNDTCSLNNVLPYYYVNNPTKGDNMEVELFTDRKIYRPGQTVSFKGVCYVRDYKKPYVLENKNVSVIFRDGNYKEIARKSFRTNSFGSFNGSFEIPETTKNGNFTLSVDERYFNNIMVEEYKRPSFLAEFEQIEREVFFGDEMSLNCVVRTYSGVNLQDGNVKWRIERHPIWRFARYTSYDSSSRQVAEGNTVINSEGKFSIHFTPKKDNDFNGNNDIQYRYIAYAQIIDSKGETQDCEVSFCVGDKGLNIGISAATTLDKDNSDIIIYTHTVNSKIVDKEGMLKLYEVDNNGKEGKEVAKCNFISGKVVDQKFISSVPSGKYLLKAETTDSKGQICSKEREIIIYGKTDKRPPVFRHTWLIKDNKEYLPGENVEFTFGTSDSSAYVLYELFDSEGKRFYSDRFILSNENKKFNFSFEEKHGKGFTAAFMFIKNGKLYQDYLQVKRRQEDRKINFHINTFRDKLLPGSNEHWSFRLTDKDSLPVKAEILAGMYDMSLDDIAKFNWNFNPNVSVTLKFKSFNGGWAFENYNGYDSEKIKYRAIMEYSFDTMYEDWYKALNNLSYGRNFALRGMVLSKSMAAAPMGNSAIEVREDAAVMEESEVTSDEKAFYSVEQSAMTGNTGSPMSIRKNFQENAFFYPVLVSNENGDFSFDFTMPESNTTWKLQMLTWTDSLKYGYIQKEIVTSKPLMVQPSLPRFFRVGDIVYISSQIINQSGEEAKGRARLELFNPENGEPVVCLTKSQKVFELAAGEITTVSWSFQVPEVKDGVIGCRIIAEGDKFSDGEQTLVPVLSDKIMLTVSNPFFINKEGKKVISPKEEQDGKIIRSIVEISANPVWYAVQSLPALSEARNESSLSWFAVYYSNILANHIANSNPEISKAIEIWKAKGNSDLISNLEKNKEIKNILLEETPWVRDAENETERMQRLDLLLQANRASQMRQTALEKLISKQNPDGGWSWFEGMRGNRFITLQILKGMGQLVEMNAVEYKQEEKEMQIKALRFLDNEIRKEYERLTKSGNNIKDYIPYDEQIEYLFVRSMYRDIPEGDARDASRFYTEQAKKYWKKLSIHNRAALAVLLWRNGDKETAQEILKWFRKTATVSDDKGMFWANNRSTSYSKYSVIDTHCLIMQAFRESKSDNAEIDLMKQWLLAQKRTQQWESEPATMNAIHSLLTDGTNWLSEGNECIISWNGETYSTENEGNIVGYSKIVKENEVSGNVSSDIVVEKKGNAPAWGAVYQQYFVPLDKVRKNKTDLNIEKKVFVEVNNGKEIQLKEVTKDNPLKVGDKAIVRLTVRSGMDMDFVCIKDLRAGCFEPVSQVSKQEYREGISFFRSPKDASENFFIDFLPAGTFVIEYSVYVSREGEYSGGICTIQCLYAPEFISNTEGYEIESTGN